MHPHFAIEIQIIMKKGLVALAIGAVSFAAFVPLSSAIAQSLPFNASGTRVAQNQGQGNSLTPEQKAQLQQLRASAKQQVEAVLTPDQRSQYQAAIAQGKSPKAALQSLNLSSDQKTQIKAIHENTYKQMQAIAPNLGHHKGKGMYANLTPNQKSQMQALHQSTKQQIDAILTPDQRSQYQAALAQGKSPKEAMRGLNLSSTQQTQIEGIRRQAKAQKQAILNAQ